MRDIPADILAQYAAVLAQRSVSPPHHGYYKKWLRYYLDFCATRDLPESRPERVRRFLTKAPGEKTDPGTAKVEKGADLDLSFFRYKANEEKRGQRNLERKATIQDLLPF
jgi:hypothetical protein